jgi:valyl-tRNA synthetase
LFQAYQYGEAGRQIYEFFWSDFADWYVEAAKRQMASGGECAFYTAQTLARVLDISLRLLHPITPFVTEELWGHLRRALLASPLAELAKDWPEALIIASWPEPRPEEDWEAEKVADFTLIQNIHSGIRNLRAEKKINPRERLSATFVSSENIEMLQQQVAGTAYFSGLDPEKVVVTNAIKYNPEVHYPLVVDTVEIYFSASEWGISPKEGARIQKEISESQVQIDRLEKLLGSDFANRAPAAVVLKERERLAAYQETAEKLKAQL